MQLANFEMRDGIAWIRVDDGKVNVMSTAMLEEIGLRLKEAANQQATAVLCGRAGVFSAGFDLNTIAKGGEAAQKMLHAGVKLIEQFLTHPYPIVGACTGHAYPMGAFLLLAADHRIGIKGDWRIGMNEVAVGITLPPFALALARHRLTPAAVAQTTIAKMYTPEQALQNGYLDELIETETFEVTILEKVVDLVAALDMQCYAATKEQVNGLVLAEIRQYLQHFEHAA